MEDDGQDVLQISDSKELRISSWHFDYNGFGEEMYVLMPKLDIRIDICIHTDTWSLHMYYIIYTE